MFVVVSKVFQNRKPILLFYIAGMFGKGNLPCFFLSVDGACMCFFFYLCRKIIDINGKFETKKDD